MPKFLAAKYILVATVMMSFLYFAGCGKPSPRQDMSEDLDRQTQERILHKARVDFEQGRDREVINELNRFLSVHSDSPRESEARWLLAESYQRSGKLRAALKQYSIISQSLPPGQEQKEVSKRIDDLNHRLNKVDFRLEPIKAVRTSLTEASLMKHGPETLKKLVQEGVTGVLIDFGCTRKMLPQSPTAVKTSDASPESQLPSTVGQIHQYGLLAFVGINPPCLGYLNSRSNKQWLDGIYNPVSRKVQLSPYFDIFHPQYRKLMAHEIKKLSDSGIDGIVFLGEVPLGLYDGFTPRSVQLFNKTFHTRMNPQTLFKNGLQQGNSEPSAERNQQPNLPVSPASEFWRWIGWKARQRLMVLQALMDQVHEHHPELPFGLELHPESVEDPLGALIQFGEDFFEANQKSFTFFLVTPKSGRTLQSETNPIDLEDFIKQSRKLVDRMTMVMGNPARIWLSTIPWSHKTSLAEVPDSPETIHLQKVSRIYDLQPFLDK